MPADDVDAPDNPAVRRSLDALERLHADFLTRKDAFAQVKPNTLAGLALAERRRLEEALAQNGEISDFDPLALSAMQEALRTTIRPGASGFEVSLEEIGDAMGRVDYLALWHNFFLHYVGNIFEWRLGAAGDGRSAEDIEHTVATLRSSSALVFADAVLGLLHQERKKDVDAAVKCMRQEMES